MKRAAPLLVAVVVTVVVAALVCGLTAVGAGPAAAAVTAAGRGTAAPGSGGWYWPIGTEDFGSYAGFLSPRGSNVHVAQDMHAKKGSPVYAIGEGIVWMSRAATGGYGVGDKPGGCIKRSAGSARATVATRSTPPRAPPGVHSL